jgi:hypothetical protein
MKLSHKRARTRFETALDAVRFDGQKTGMDHILSEHLAGCPECRGYADQSAHIDAHLAQHMPEAWQSPDFSNLQIEQAIKKVHGRVNKKTNATRQNLWGEMQHAWRWSIGLAGIVILAGVLIIGMRLIPQNTNLYGVDQPTRNHPSLPPQTAVPTPTVTHTPQGTGRAIDGEWIATTDFGKLSIYVYNAGTRIKKISYQASKWLCGTGTIIEASEIVDASGWMITDNKFSVDSTLDQNMQHTMHLEGTYDAINQRFYGTWQESSRGAVCSGTWEASIITPEPTATQVP